MRRSITSAVRRLAQSRGFELVRRGQPNSSSASRRPYLMRSRVTQALDIGANVGDYGALLRAEGFEGPIYSFEPLSAAFEQLQKRASADPLWHCRREGLGAAPGSKEMNLSKNVVSSSLLEIAEICVDQDPDTAYVGRETIAITTLDEIASDLPNVPTWLKLDVQGYELQVLEGGARFLDRVQAIECELSLVPLYVGQPLMEEVIDYLRRRNFVPSWIEPGVIHRGTGALLQTDVIFEREN